MKQKTTDDMLVDVFSDLDKRPDFPVKEIRKKVAFVSTPRCGSSMFCDILLKTGMVGDPKEWINIRYLNAYAKYLGKRLTISQYLDFIFRKTTSSNGIFSINFHVDQYLRMLGNNKFDVFTLNFDKSYYLYRKEKIDQAYSLAKAIITDQWSANAGPVNNAQEIMLGKRAMLESLLLIGEWEEYYHNVMKTRIDREYFYEDFSSLDTTSAFTEVLADLGISNLKQSWTTSLVRQRNDQDLSEIASLKEYLLPSLSRQR